MVEYSTLHYIIKTWHYGATTRCPSPSWLAEHSNVSNLVEKVDACTCNPTNCCNRLASDGKYNCVCGLQRSALRLASSVDYNKCHRYSTTGVLDAWQVIRPVSQIEGERTNASWWDCAIQIFNGRVIVPSSVYLVARPRIAVQLVPIPRHSDSFVAFANWYFPPIQHKRPRGIHQSSIIISNINAFLSALIGGRRLFCTWSAKYGNPSLQATQGVSIDRQPEKRIQAWFDVFKMNQLGILLLLLVITIKLQNLFLLHLWLLLLDLRTSINWLCNI